MNIKPFLSGINRAICHKDPEFCSKHHHLMHRKLTDNRIIFLYMKIHCSPINRHPTIPSSIWPFVIYSCLPGETWSLWPFLGWTLQSLFLCSSVHQWPLLTYQSIIVLTKFTWSKTFLFLFLFCFRFQQHTVQYWIKAAIFMIIHLLRTWHFFDLLNTNSGFN